MATLTLSDKSRPQIFKVKLSFFRSILYLLWFTCNYLIVFLYFFIEMEYIVVRGQFTHTVRYFALENDLYLTDIRKCIIQIYVWITLFEANVLYFLFLEQQFPHATGLCFFQVSGTRTESWAVLSRNGKLVPPRDGWIAANRTYMAVEKSGQRQVHDSVS